MTSRRWDEESGNPLQPLRDAAAARALDTTLRGTAREIGLDAGDLRRFLQGHRPYPPNLDRLRAWFLRQGHALGGRVSREDAQAALGILLREVAPEVRGEIADGILHTLARGYDRSGKRRPAWMYDLSTVEERMISR